MSAEKLIFDRRKSRTRKRIAQVSGGRPRLSVFRSGRYMYVQVIDDVKHCTLVSASSIESARKEVVASGSNCEAARWVGLQIAQRALEAGVKTLVFDRGPYRYHGRVKALAEGAREGGLEF
jgi:large subunit ribosomal protein L18